MTRIPHQLLYTLLALLAIPGGRAAMLFAPAPGPSAAETFSYADDQYQVKGDAAVLLSLLKRMSGFSSVYQSEQWTGWDVETPVCAWTGITCNLAGRVENVTIATGGYIDNDGWAHQASTSASYVKGNASVVLMHLAKLPALKAIRFPFQGLTGTLPGAEFSTRVPNLEELYLTDSNIQGSIPKDWSFQHLKRLDLRTNVFSNGTIPWNWGSDGVSFQELELLHISRYSSAFLSLLSSSYDASSAGFESSTIPDNFASQLPSLRSLLIQGANVTGTLPLTLGNLNLTSLHLYNNFIVGSLPGPLASNGKWPAMKTIDLANNNLSGSIPESWGNAGGSLSVLTKLDLGQNNFSGSLPASWLSRNPKRFPALRELVLGDNDGLCGPVPYNVSITSDSAFNSINSLGSCSDSFSGNRSSNTTAQAVLLDLAAKIPNFRQVYDAYQMTGWGVNASGNSSLPVCQWSLVGCDSDGHVNHVTFNLNKTSVRQHESQAGVSYGTPVAKQLWTEPNTTAGPPLRFKGNVSDVLLSLAQLHFITHIDIANNEFSGPLPGAKFSDLAQYLVLLFAGNNKITGGIPSGQDWTLPNLQILELFGNPLRGSLPNDWGSNTTALGSPLLFLKAIDFSNCSLEGKLPESWPTNLKNLSFVALTGNSLTGSLPASYANLTKMQIFFAQRNNLSGTLPGSWGDNSTGVNMKKLMNLQLGSNNLSGELPREWGRAGGFHKLTFLNLARNQLTGTVPKTYRTFNESAMTNNITVISQKNITFPYLERLDLLPGNPGLCGPVPLNVSVFQEEYEVLGQYSWNDWRPLLWSNLLGGMQYQGNGRVNTTMGQNTTTPFLGACSQPSA